MKELLTYLITGITLGASFALIGSGFVVVHRVTRIVNFAQGSFAILAAMLASSLLATVFLMIAVMARFVSLRKLFGAA